MGKIVKENNSSGKRVNRRRRGNLFLSSVNYLAQVVKRGLCGSLQFLLLLFGIDITRDSDSLAQRNSSRVHGSLTSNLLSRNFSFDFRTSVSPLLLHLGMLGEDVSDNINNAAGCSLLLSCGFLDCIFSF